VLSQPACAGHTGWKPRLQRRALEDPGGRDRQGGTRARRRTGRQTGSRGRSGRRTCRRATSRRAVPDIDLPELLQPAPRLDRRGGRPAAAPRAPRAGSRSGLLTPDDLDLLERILVPPRPGSRSFDDGGVNTPVPPHRSVRLVHAGRISRAGGPTRSHVPLSTRGPSHFISKPPGSGARTRVAHPSERRDAAPGIVTRPADTGRP